ncbi:MAG: hypothetical protein AAF682_29060 [Planctomycetota bacterium]
MRAIALFALFPTLSLVAAAQNAVFVVDDDGGPGVDFTDLPAAVLAAADGDTLLVRDGQYSAFELDAKGLAVVADAAAPPVIDGGLAVRNLAAGQVALLRGLATGDAAGDGLRLAANVGAVRVEDCTLVGADGVSPSLFIEGHAMGYDGLSIAASADVSVAGSTFTAGDGANLYDIYYGAMGIGGAGLRVDDASVAVFDSTFTGGEGGSDSSGFALSGTTGGTGALVLSGLLLSSGSAFTGGEGGSGGSAWYWKGCGDGGNGGAGLHVLGGELADLDNAFAGGSFGFGVTYYGCTHGADGASLLAAPGTQLTPLAGAARGFSTPAPMRAGVSSDLVFRGEPGDVAVVGFSFGTGFAYVPAWLGTLLIGAPQLAVAAGVVPPGGELLVPIAYSGLAGGVDAEQVYAQAAFLDGAGVLRLGPASSTVLLAPGF